LLLEIAEDGAGTRPYSVFGCRGFHIAWKIKLGVLSNEDD
jgi:hypothetical protein